MFLTRVLATAALAATGLAVSALPASAATTTMVLYSGTEVSTTTAIDRSGGGHNGTLYNGAKATGSGYTFTGTKGNRIATPASSATNPGTANFTYGVTMQLPAGYTFSHDLSLIRRGSAKFAGAFYKMELVYHKDTGKTLLICQLRDSDGSTGYVATGGANLADGAWHTLTCKKTASSLTLVKGGSTYTKASNGTLGSLDSTTVLNIGAEQIDATTFWESYVGQMKDIRLTRG